MIHDKITRVVGQDDDGMTAIEIVGERITHDDGTPHAWRALDETFIYYCTYCGVEK